MKFDASLIISVYNKVRELNFVLAALERQSFKNFEIIIADDGSKNEIKDVVDFYRNKNSLFISHIWQPDDGFRKNKILNKSIIHSSTDYLIFIDGDCIPHHKFVEEHIYNRESNTVLCGSRVLLSKNFSDNLKLIDITNGVFENFNMSLLFESFLRQASRIEEAIYIKNKIIRKILKNRNVRLLGSNFSIEKRLLFEVNGFNEEYEAPGLGEDSDLEYRLSLLNVKFKSVRNLAILYHLYHPKTIESPNNRILFESKKMEKRFKAKFGIKESLNYND